MTTIRACQKLNSIDNRIGLPLVMSQGFLVPSLIPCQQSSSQTGMAWEVFPDKTEKHAFVVGTTQVHTARHKNPATFRVLVCATCKELMKCFDFNPLLLNPSNAEGTFVQDVNTFENHLNPVMLVFTGKLSLSTQYQCSRASVIFQVFCLNLYWPNWHCQMSSIFKGDNNSHNCI